MPAVNTGRENTTVQPKRKVKVRKPKTKPVTVAPADRVADRVAARKVQVQKSKSLSPDRQDTKRSDAQKARDAKVVATNVKVSRARAASNQKSVDDPGPVKLLPKYAKSRAVSKAQTIGRVAPVLKVLDQTTRPLHAIAAGTDAAVQGRNVPKALKAGIENKDKTTFSTVLKHAGVKNKYVRGGAGFILDVGLDPTTYLTGGTGAVIKKAAIKEGEAAAEKATTGLTVKVAGKEVPGVRRATAKAGEGGGKAFRKAVPERVRNATRDAASEVNPNVAPSGVDKATHQAARRVSRKARAATTKGEREAINLGRGIKSQIGEKNYARVTDAVEAGDTSKLPAELRGHAETVKRHLAEIRTVQKSAGLKAPERKGYTPHKLTEKAAKDEQKKTARVGGRSTELKSSKARKEQRAMAELRVQEPGRYREDLHALVAERMAEGTSAAARANLAKDVAALGHEVQRGSNPRLSDREAVYKFKDGKLTEVDPRSKAFQKKPPADGLKAKYVVLNKSLVDRTMGSAATPSGGAIKHGYDRAQSNFKRVALATPGFHIRNAIGDTAQAYVHQPGQKLTGNMVRAGRVLKAQGRIERAEQKLGTATDRGGKLKTKRYGHVTYEEAARRLVEAGAARSGYTSRELRELGSSGKKLKVPKTPGAIRRGFLNREDLPRLATAIHAVRQGATWEEAAAKVADVHFDYADLTPFERNTMRRIMPFYTWTARNVPLQAKSIVSKPGKYAAYQKVRENAAQLTSPDAQDPKTLALYKKLEAAGVKLPGGWEKYLTTYEQRNAGVPVSWKGNKFTVSAGLPLGDLNELPGMSGPGEYLNKAASLVTPLVKDPVEFGFNYSFFFRDQVERDNSPLVAAPSFVGKWPDSAKKKFGIVKAQDKRSGKMIWQWPGKADYVAHAVPGLPSTVVKMMTPGHDRQGKGTAAKALGVAGIKAAPVDATTNAINMAYARGQEIQKRQAVLRKQNNPANGRLISAKNPTPEYTRLLSQLRTANQIAYQGKSLRKDAVLPTQGGPKKPRSGNTGRVKVPGVTGRIKVPGGAGGRVKVP